MRIPTRRRASVFTEALENRTLLSSWFVAPTGSDANPGSLSAPFRTVQHAAALAKAGDSVFLRGGVYHESIRPAHSGTSSAPITFENYNNEAVTIDGADPITGWKTAGTNVYKAPQGWDLGEGNNQVFVDGQMNLEARWPNASLDVSHPTFSTFQSVSATNTSCTIKDPALKITSNFWNGATIHFTAGDEWFGQSGTVTASGYGWLTFSYTRSLNYMNTDLPRATNHYYLVGKAGALDNAGEWFYDSSAHALSLQTGSGVNPASHIVEAKHRTTAFDLTGRSYITVVGLKIFAANIVTDSNSTGIVLNKLNCQYMEHFTQQVTGRFDGTPTGISLMGSNDLIENSKIGPSVGDGVYIGGTYCRVTNCVIHDTDYGASNSAPVRIYGAHATIDHSTIDYAGRDGIDLHAAPSTILNNVIHDVGIQTTDVGAVYAVRQAGQNTRIGYNIIYNVVTGGFGGTGVFLDDYSGGYIVDHNLTTNVNAGVKINWTSQNDLFVSNTFDALTYSVAYNSAYDWSGTQFVDDIFTKPVQIGKNATLSNNLYSTVNPQFVDPAHGNFQLTSSSPAIGKGKVMMPYTPSKSGSPPDIGVFQYGQPRFSSGASFS